MPPAEWKVAVLRMRLFIACRIPSSAAAAIADVTNVPRHSLPAASWVRERSLHLTFAFLGEQSPETISPLASALTRRLTDARAIDATLGRIGFFPSSGRPRVGWLAVEPAEPLIRIAGNVRGAVHDCGLPIDEKPFVPHLTIVRMKESWKEQDRADLVRAFSGLTVRTALLEAVDLIRSSLKDDGPCYENLASIPLASGGGSSVDESDSSGR